MPPDSIPAAVRAAGPTPLIECTLDDGVLAAVIDMPGRTMNVFSPELMDALESLTERIRSDGAVRGVVLTSGKPSFIVGADLEMIREFTERADREPRPAMHELIARLGRLFNRLEELAKPVVAAINGLALGGGLEICLASTYRIAADDPSVQIGLPEIKLGLLPGAGGTQRLPRLIGTEKGLQLLLSGASVSPKEALELGLLDEVVARDRLIERAKTVARDLAKRPITPRYLKPLDPGLFRFDEPHVFETMAAHYGLSQQTMETYPAYVAIMRCVVEGASMELTSAVDNEMARFIDLMYDETAGNMVRTLFLDRQRADKALLDVRAESNFCVVLTATGPAADSIAAALSRAKIAVVDAGGATNSDILIAPPGLSARGRVDLVLLSQIDDEVAGADVGILLASSKSYGRALEIVVARESQQGTLKALALARRLGATPFVHRGSRSMLAALSDAEAQAQAAGLDRRAVLLAQALRAASFRDAGHVADTRTADVASVVSGRFPAYAGGPFTFLRRRGPAWVAAEARRHADAAPILMGLAHTVN